MFHKEYLGTESEENSVSDIDKEIINYIYKDVSIDQCLIEDARWEVFYHLAPVRQSLFHWYDFRLDTDILELGCEFGAITPLFCQKCRKVLAIDWSYEMAEAAFHRNRKYQNLDVYAGDLDELDTAYQFDYIVLMPSYYGDHLQQTIEKVKRRLKQDGELLLVAKNKIGADVIAGKVCNGNRPFCSLRGAADYYSYHDLENILENASFTERKFYYPFPDYVYPQEIYTDEYLPKIGEINRNVEYFPHKESIVFRPSEFIYETIKNDIFKWCTNSFLIECRLSEKSDNKLFYAALSTDRERSAAYVTKIYGGEKVTKTPIFPEGQAGLQNLLDNMEQLKKRGIATISQRRDGVSIVMPYISSTSLIQYIEDNWDNVDRLDYVLNILYQQIMKSSDHISSCDNAMLHYDSMVEWGIILQDAYIDMIPLNCFWQNNEIVFFDQEFKRANFPLKYVMFRVLWYTYLSLQASGRDFALEYYKDKYCLNDVWDYCRREEDKFIYENRNHRIYKNFYNWVALSDEEIEQNIERLLGKRMESTAGIGEEWIGEGIRCLFLEGFYDKELDECGFWRWTNQNTAKMLFVCDDDLLGTFKLEFEILLANLEEKRIVDIFINDQLWESVLAPVKVVIPIQFDQKRRICLNFHDNYNGMTSSDDPRRLFLQFRNYRLQKEKNGREFI